MPFPCPVTAIPSIRSASISAYCITYDGRATAREFLQQVGDPDAGQAGVTGLPEAAQHEAQLAGKPCPRCGPDQQHPVHIEHQGVQPARCRSSQPRKLGSTLMG
jgi:hypothetical protein